MTAITGHPHFSLEEWESTRWSRTSSWCLKTAPANPSTLQWATYRDASDQCSLSRIWGGIHPPADDFPGRQLGVEVAAFALNRVTQFFAPRCREVDLCPLDLDGDGVVGAATDLLEALADFGSYGTDLAGLLLTYRVTKWSAVNDVLDLLASYGESCP